MNQRFFLSLFISAILLAGLILTIAFLPAYKQHSQDAILSYNDVRGIAVEYQGLLYTLNFEQQKQVIEALNHQKEMDSINFGVPSADRIIIYLFNEPDQIIEQPYVKRITNF